VISSGAKIKINLSLVPEPEDTFKSFMRAMDDDVSRLENALASDGTLARDVLNGALQVTKNIMDIVAEVRRSYFYLVLHRSNG
jgi:chemotaxis regulatin CheY-phosphate phosphatase CheZ